VHFRIEQRFALPLETVENGLHDPRFIESMAELPRLGRPQLLSSERIPGEVHQRVRYAFAGELSSAVRAVVKPDLLTWVEDSTVDLENHESVFDILPDHYASLLRCHGTFVLVADGPRSCSRVAEGEIKVSVPLVGGKVERAIVSGLDEHAQAEVGLLEAWAAGESA